MASDDGRAHVKITATNETKWFDWSAVLVEKPENRAPPPEPPVADETPERRHSKRSRKDKKSSQTEKGDDTELADAPAEPSAANATAPKFEARGGGAPPKFVGMMKELERELSNAGLASILSMTDIDWENITDWPEFVSEILATASLYYDPGRKNPAAPHTNPNNSCYQLPKRELLVACGQDAALGEKLIIYDQFPLMIGTHVDDKRLSAHQIPGAFDALCKKHGLEGAAIKRKWDKCLAQMHKDLEIPAANRFAFGRAAAELVEATCDASEPRFAQHPEATRASISKIAQKIRDGDPSVKDNIWCIPSFDFFKESDEAASRLVSILAGEEVVCDFYIKIYNNDKEAIEFVRDLHRKNCVELWLKKSQHEKFEWYLRMKNFTGGNWDTAVDGLLMRDDGDGDATSEVFINSLSPENFASAVSAACSLWQKVFSKKLWDDKSQSKKLEKHRDLVNLTTASWSAAVCQVSGVAKDVDVWTSEYVDGMSDADFDEALEIAKKSKVVRLQHAINNGNYRFTKKQAFPDMSDEEIEALTEDAYKDGLKVGGEAVGQVMGTKVERTRARREAEKVLDASGRPVDGKFVVNPDCGYKTDKSNSLRNYKAHFKTCTCCRDFAVGVQSGEVTIEGEWPDQRSVLNWALKAQKGGVQFGERINKLPPSKSTLRKRKAATGKAPAKKVRA